jgi:hypothetical protein
VATKIINQMVNEVVDSKTLVFYFTHRLQARLNRLHKNYPKRTVQALDKNAKRERECGQYTESDTESQVKHSDRNYEHGDDEIF